jgi:hypothetical protein
MRSIPRVYTLTAVIAMALLTLLALSVQRAKATEGEEWKFDINWTESVVDNGVTTYEGYADTATRTSDGQVRAVPRIEFSGKVEEVYDDPPPSSVNNPDYFDMRSYDSAYGDAGAVTWTTGGGAVGWVRIALIDIFNNVVDGDRPYACSPFAWYCRGTFRANTAKSYFVEPFYTNIGGGPTFGYINNHWSY